MPGREHLTSWQHGRFEICLGAGSARAVKTRNQETKASQTSRSFHDICGSFDNMGASLTNPVFRNTSSVSSQLAAECGQRTTSSHSSASVSGPCKTRQELV